MLSMNVGTVRPRNSEVSARSGREHRRARTVRSRLQAESVRNAVRPPEGGTPNRRAAGGLVWVPGCRAHLGTAPVAAGLWPAVAGRLARRTKCFDTAFAEDATSRRNVHAFLPGGRMPPSTSGGTPDATSGGSAEMRPRMSSASPSGHNLVYIP